MYRKLHGFFAAIAAALAILSATSAPAVMAQTDAPLAGSWLGSLQVGAVQLRIVFNISVDSTGAYTATLDSPDQGAQGIPVGSVVLQADSVQIGVPMIGGRYDGTLAETGSRIEGRWSQGGQSFSLDLDRTEAPFTLVRPQEPKPPFPYRVEEVVIPNEAAGIRLAGTLTIPEGEGPHPGVVLVTGSGPQDRDEALLGHKPFAVLADYLTRRGIAVLRHDDRGVGGSTGDFATALTPDFAEDAVAAVNFLRDRDEIDEDRVGLVGHSEGGLSGPLAALAAPEAVNFLVLLAPPGISGDQILYLQDSLMMAAAGASKEMIEVTRTRKDALFPVIRSVEGVDERRDSLMKVMSSFEFAAEEQAYYDSAGVSLDQLIAQQVSMMSSDWFRWFMTYDPAPTLRKLAVPVLAIIGEKDLQVPAEQNIPALEAALAGSGTDDYLVRELPGLNHLFQHAETGHISEYSKIEETFAPEALKLIGDWILEHVESQN
ncbi:MAG TPA: alpha/beta fold hydrolase [Rhodothermales bacterium]